MSMITDNSLAENMPYLTEQERDDLLKFVHVADDDYQVAVKQCINNEDESIGEVAAQHFVDEYMLVRMLARVSGTAEAHRQACTDAFFSSMAGGQC